MAAKTKRINSNLNVAWFVRDESGGVFGPVDFDTLKLWVVDGRVSPQSRVSRDERKSWISAVGIPELEMDTVAEIDAGSFYGPIHRKAMSGLIDSGSIPANAVIYRREIEGAQPESAPDVEESEGLSAQEFQRLVEREIALEAERDKMCAAAEELRSETDSLRGQVEELCAERSRMHTEVRSLQDADKERSAEIGRLGNELKISAANYEKQCARAHDLEEKLHSLKLEIAGLRDSADELSAAHHKEVSALSAAHHKEMSALREEAEQFRSREAEAREECAALQREVDSLRKNTHEQQRLMDERERLHAAEQKERDKVCNLRIESLVVEHESAINSTRHDFLEQIRALRDELLGSHEDISALRKRNEELEEEKARIERKLQDTDRQSRNEHGLSENELRKKERKIGELMNEVAELKKTNELLKQEFIRFEEAEECDRRMDLSARRRLIVLKQLFIEAAGLLEGVDQSEGDAEKEHADEEPARDSAPGEETVELLDFEEIAPEESPHGRKAPDAGGNPLDRRRVERVSSGSDDPPQKKPAKDEASGGRRWPFSKGKREMDRQSLAELEAQARSELQRLSSSGNLAAIFDRKKNPNDR